MITGTCAEMFRYYAGWCTKLSTASSTTSSRPAASWAHTSNMHAYTLKEPYGVVGLIFPWNGRSSTSA